MKVGKPKSKRTPVRLRHKIEKASANKQRKQRKEAKKNPQWRSRLKKDPGIPNLFPYKDKVLAEIEESKRKKEEEKEKRKELARAQREGRTVVSAAVEEAQNTNEEIAEETSEHAESSDGDEDMEDDGNGSNALAALVASAQARANAYTRDDEDDEDEDDEDDEDEDEHTTGGAPVSTRKRTSATKTSEAPKKTLPKSVLADPIKPVSRLLARLDQTPDGIQQILAYYQLPPLATAGSDTTTRFLVDVARKRGRMGRGGIPNLHAAALTVLSDLNEERLKLPALQQQKSAVAAKGNVQIVSQLAQPFRIEGLFGDQPAAAAGAMEVES